MTRHHEGSFNFSILDTPRRNARKIQTPEPLSSHRIFDDARRLEQDINSTQMDASTRAYHTDKLVTVLNQEATKSALAGELVELRGHNVRVPYVAQIEGIDDQILTTVPIGQSLSDEQRQMAASGLFVPSVTGRFERFFALHQVDPTGSFARTALQLQVFKGNVQLPFSHNAPVSAYGPVASTDIEFFVDTEMHKVDRALEFLYSLADFDDMRVVNRLHETLIAEYSDATLVAMEEIHDYVFQLVNTVQFRREPRLKDALLDLVKSRFKHPGSVYELEADCIVDRKDTRYVVHTPPKESFMLRASVEDVVLMTDSDQLADSKVNDIYAPYFAVSPLNAKDVSPEDIIYVPLKYIKKSTRVS